MSISSLKWVEGAPEKLQAGMVIRTASGLVLVGSVNEHGSTTGHQLGSIDPTYVQRWAWAIAPFEMDWLDDMGTPAKLVAA